MDRELEMARKLGVLKMKKRLNNSVEVTVVFPVYNEADILSETIEKTRTTLNTFVRSYEIIIAEDGSTDGTDYVASSLSKQNSFVRHLHGEKRLGRGRALKKAFKKSRGEVLVYMDVDLATDLKHLKSLIGAIWENYDFATGSRLLPESKNERTFARRLTSKSYNFFVKTLLGSKISDHQCGFKSFKRVPLLGLIDEVAAAHWFWDTEVLVRASYKQYKIKEIPVEWKGSRKTKVNLLRDSLDMGFQVIKLWWKLKTKSPS